MSKEQWKDIPGFESFYQASTHGRIMRIVKGPSTKQGRILKQQKHHSGYMQVCLCVNGRQYKSLRIHKLVLTTFVGPKLYNYQCRHLDGNKQNNHLPNLKWGTPKENANDRHKHGRYIGICGSKNNSSKLIEKQIIEIKLLTDETSKNKHNKKILLREIALKYGVSISTISCIKNNKTWKHMEEQNV